jgi:nitroreductase
MTENAMNPGSPQFNDPSERHLAPQFAEMATLGRVIRSRRTSMNVDASAPVSDRLIEQLCELATWAPCHKRTWPWRFASLTGPARRRLGDTVADAMAVHGDDTAKVTKTRTKYERTPNVLVVGSAPGDTELRTLENRDAVAAGVEHILLGATAAGVASYWSTCPKGANDAVAGLCAFEVGTTIVAIIYLGWASDTTVAVPNRPAPTITRLTT